MSDDRETTSVRQRGRTRRRSQVPKGDLPTGLSAPVGGRLAPLSDGDLSKIHDAALTILADFGMSEAPPTVVKSICSAGGSVTDENRLTFSRDLVGHALTGLRRGFTLFGQTPGWELDLSGARVHVGSGGAAPQILDHETGRYRGSTLADLYDAARLVDRLDNIHFFARSLVARDMPDTRTLDINTTFASLAGTRKHVMVSASDPAHVREIAAMCFAIAGSAEAFRKRPFLSLNINHAVPPLRFSEEAAEVLVEASVLGLPVMVNTFGQLGASSPVTIAGSVAQTHAETLAGLVVAWVINPEVLAVYGARPMVTDLRSGGMAGGSGEQALLTAVSTQMARFCDLPNSTIAGATDSKIADAQAGYEKALSVSMTAQAGANLITQAAGMQAGLMGVSFEAYVIDNDMLGAILRATAKVEVSSATLSTQMIIDSVRGEGHFLGHADTYRRMKTDFLYPSIADRRPLEAWETDGSRDIRSLARDRVRDILSSHFPDHLSGDIQRKLRNAHDIRLPEERMHS